MEVNEEYLGEYLSVYLGRGSFWTRRVLGVYVTKNRIIGVQLGWNWYHISWATLAVAMGVFIGVYGPYATNGILRADSFWLFVPIFLVPLMGTIVLTWSASIIEMRLKHRGPLTMEEVQVNKCFEVRRDQISHIVMQRNTVLSPGSLTITLRAGTFFHVSIFNSFRNNGKRFDQLKQLIEFFCMKQFVIRPPNLLVWTL